MPETEKKAIKTQLQKSSGNVPSMLNSLSFQISEEYCWHRIAALFLKIFCAEYFETQVDLRDPRSHEHYWTSSWNSTWKKIQVRTGLNFFSGLISTTS